MAGDDDRDAGCGGTDVEFRDGMNEVEEVSGELDELGGGESGAGAVGVDVAADDGDRSELAEGVEDLDVTDVAGVEDVLSRGRVRRGPRDAEGRGCR